jgi:hypothetical protein
VVDIAEAGDDMAADVGETLLDRVDAYGDEMVDGNETELGGFDAEPSTLPATL